MDRKSAPPFPGWLLWFEAGLLTLLGTVLVGRLYPFLWWGDEPELLTAAWEGGVAHPTGYPLYLILVRMFGLLPLGSVAWKGHLFSAVCLLVGIGLLFRLEKPEEGRPYQSAGWRLGVLAIGFFPAIVGQSVIAEVYAFSFLLLAAVLLAARRFLERPRLIAFLWICLWAGLGIGHHRLLGLALPGVAFLLAGTFSEDPKRVRWVLPGAAVLILSVFLPYGVLVWRARYGDPPLNYDDPSGWSGFWHLFTASQFRVDQELIRLREWAYYERGLGPSPWGITTTNLSQIPASMAENLRLLSPFLLIGFLGLLRFHFRLLLAGILSILLPVFFVVQYHVGDPESFLFLPLALAGLGAATGVAFLGRVAQEIRPWAGAAALLFSAVAVGEIAWSYSPPPGEVLELPERYARRVLDRVPEGSVLLAVPTQDSLPVDYTYFPLLFQHEVAERNSGAIVVSTGFHTSPWYRSSFARQGLSTELFDHLEGKTGLLDLTDFSQEDYLKRTEKDKSRSPANGSPYSFYRHKGRVFGKDWKAVAALMAKALIPAFGDRPLYATSPYRVVEPFLSEPIEWQEVLSLPMRTRGYRGLDHAPIPSGKLFLAHRGRVERSGGGS